MFSAGVLLCLTLLTPQDVAGDLRRAFRPAKEAGVDMGPRLTAVEAAIGTRDEAAARALVDVWVQLEKELLVFLEKHREHVLRGFRDKGQEARPGVDARRELPLVLKSAIEGLSSSEALEPLVERALEDRRLDLSIRLTLAKHAGVVADPAKMLKRAAKMRKPEDRMVALAFAEALGPAAMPLASYAVDGLTSPLAVVREAAVDALVAMEAPSGIEPLVARLSEEHGRTRQRMVSALQVLTGQRISGSQEAWRRWLEREGAPYVGGERELGLGDPLDSEDAGGPTYHGLPLDGAGILFVIDVSKSMNRTMTKPSKPTKDPALSRMGRAKEELISALGKLRPGQRFDVVAFGGKLERFGEELTEADEKTVAGAQTWVRELGLSLGTRMHDALELAFHAAGQVPGAGLYDSTVDTVFLLTDGRPIVGGKADRGDAIRTAVQRWNLRGRVVLHTIGLGDDLPKNFLKALAADNGGRFVHEVSDG